MRRHAPFIIGLAAAIAVSLWAYALSRPAPGDAESRPALCSELETAPVHGWNRRQCVHCGRWLTLKTTTTVKVEGEE